MLVRFSPDSARTKNPIAMIAVTQKINRAAFDIFIRVLVLYTPAIEFVPEAHLTLCSSAPGYCTDASDKAKQNI
jgi:hypothetical protein